MSNILYHYTSTSHLPIILKSGYLKLTDDMLAFDYSSRKKKPVVWLTSSENPDRNGLEGSAVDKTEVRFTLERKPHYQYWRTWAKKNKIDKNMAAFLNSEEHNSSSWFVSEVVIPLKDVTRIENLKTGQVYFDPNVKIYTFAPLQDFSMDILAFNS